MVTTKLLGALLLQLAAGTHEDDRSIRAKQLARQQQRAEAAQAPPQTNGCMVITGCCVLVCDNTIGTLMRGGMAGCTKVADCVHGCWMAIPDNCAAECAQGTVKCIEGTASCCTGTVVWICKDGVVDGCVKGCCWETLAKACCYDACIKGCVVPLVGYCASGKCCADIAVCAGQCADGTVACATCIGCGCKDLTVCLATGCGDCVSGTKKLVVNCGAGCAGCVMSGCVRCMDPNEWAACATATVDCGTNVCCGLMTCCRDEICCYQQCWTREQCFNGAVACVQGTADCLACTVHLPIDCYNGLPACVDVIACCSATCSGCAQSCGQCWTGCSQSCGQCLTECQAGCGQCVTDMQLKGQECMSSCGRGLCVTLPANVHASISRTMAFLRQTAPMRVGHAIRRNVPRQAAFASMTGNTDMAWASALGASAGDNIYAQHPNMLMRQMSRWSEEQIAAFMTAYFVKLDNKWATNQAWTAFWRGDAEMNYKGRNQKLAEYKNEFRRRYNLAMCVYMDDGWHKSWSEYYPSYQVKYMQHLVDNGTITPVEMTDEQFETLGRYLMSTTEQKAEFQNLVRMYNEQRHEIREQAVVRIGDDPDARQQMRQVTVNSVRQAVAAPHREAVAAPRREAVAEDPRFFEEVSRGQLEEPLRLTAPVREDASLAQTDGWTCPECHRANHPRFNPHFCGNEACPTNQ